MRGAYPLLFMAIDKTPELVMLSVKISDPVSAFHTLYGKREREKAEKMTQIRDYDKNKIVEYLIVEQLHP